MKKKIILMTVLGLIFLILLSILVFMSSKKQDQNKINKGISITSIKQGEIITSPLKITGVVNGDGWGGFEGQVGTVRLLDSNGKELVLGILNATTDWMTSPVNFETILNFKSDKEQAGVLVFHNENPSGMPEYDRTYMITVKIPKIDTIKVQVYFGNLALSASGEQDECKRVYAVGRDINKTEAVAKSAIEELIFGPTDKEKDSGYFSNIPEWSKLNSISINNGIASLDFNSITESGGGSCSMASRVAQIKATLMQFPTIKSVNLSINGRTEDIFQP